MFWNVMHTYMHAQFAALIAFLGIPWLNWWQNYVAQFLVCLIMTRSEHEPSDGWQDREDCFTDI